MKLIFGDIVVVENGLLGVVVKNWAGDPASCEVYVRSLNSIQTYPVKSIERYQVRHKEMNEEELEYQANAEREE